jgi:hypothetical protein
MSGINGHYKHPYEIAKDGSELIQLFETAIEDIKKQRSVLKIDGISLSVRLNAENKFVIDRGSNKVLDVQGVRQEDLEERFGAGHGLIKIGKIVLDLFDSVQSSIEPELKALGVTKGSNTLLNFEYVDKKTNIIKYSKQLFIIHGIKSFSTTAEKRVFTEKETDQELLKKLFNKFNSKSQSFKMIGQSVVGGFKNGEPDIVSILDSELTLNEQTKQLSGWLSETKIDLPLITREEFKKIDSEKVKTDLTVKELSDYVIYYATITIGDEIIKAAGLDNHEGILVYGKNSFKITGSFIVKNLTSPFAKVAESYKIVLRKKLVNESTTNTTQYPVVAGTVDGREVLPEVPNMSSIEATLDDYEILSGIREVPMKDFGGPKSVFYAADDFERSKKLAETIRQSNKISPLIIIIDKEGPYILEGAHRFVALHYLGAKSFPAKVVLDLESLEESKKIQEEHSLEYPIWGWITPSGKVIYDDNVSITHRQLFIKAYVDKKISDKEFDSVLKLYIRSDKVNLKTSEEKARYAKNNFDLSVFNATKVGFVRFLVEPDYPFTCSFETSLTPTQKVWYAIGRVTEKVKKSLTAKQYAITYRGNKTPYEMNYLEFITTYDLGIDPPKMNESTESKQVIIIPGGFHPFHPGHLSLYTKAKELYPGHKIVLAASNKTETRPFSFKEKQYIAGLLGVPSDAFMEVQNPLDVAEIQKKLGTDDLLFIRGEKEFRIKNLKAKHLPMSRFKVLDKTISSGTQLRKLYQDATPEGKIKLLTDLYGKNNVSKLQTIFNKNLQINKQGT